MATEACPDNFTEAVLTSYLIPRFYKAIAIYGVICAERSNNIRGMVVIFCSLKKVGLQFFQLSFREGS